MTEKLVLISHRLCPYVQRAAIALAEKGVPFERIDIDLDAKPDWFLTISPLGKVPVLKVGDRVIFESAVILEYLEETQPGPLHPADPLARAEHRAWIEFGSSILADLWGFYTAPDAESFAAKTAALEAKFARLEARLDGGPFFKGADFSLVDAVFGPVFRYFEVLDGIADFGILAGKPKLAAWRRALAARPSVRAAVPADYPERLRRFIRDRNSHLAKLRVGAEEGVRLTA
jgi:glutathione S-transferase